MFLTLHQKFANMTPTLFPSRRRPSHGRSSTSLHACLPPPSHGPIAPARSGALRHALSERIRTARRYGACFASKLCLINCAAFPQPRSTDRRSPPSSERPAGGATVSDAESRSSRCRLGILLHLLLHTVCSYDPLRNIACEIDSRHASLAVFRAFAKNRPTQARRTNTLPAHLPCSYDASFTPRVSVVEDPTRGLFVFSPRGGWLVGSRSLAPASRAARPRRSFSRRSLAGGSCHHRDPSVPSRRGSLRGRRRRPEPRGAGRLSRASDGFFDRASSFPCRIGDPAFVRLLSRRSRIDARRAGRFRRSCTRTRGRGLVAALERERRTPGPSARSSRRGNHLFRSAKYPAPGANYLCSFSRVGALFP